MTLEERLNLMYDLRRQGYNCTQSLVMCFPDITGLDSDTAARITSAMGSGIGGLGEICGAANGIAFVAGSRFTSDPADKASAAKEARELCTQFADDNGGRIRCRDLKGKEGIRPCNELIARAIEILHNKYCKDE